MPQAKLRLQYLFYQLFWNTLVALFLSSTPAPDRGAAPAGVAKRLKSESSLPLGGTARNRAGGS